MQLYIIHGFYTSNVFPLAYVSTTHKNRNIKKYKIVKFIKN